MSVMSLFAQSYYDNPYVYDTGSSATTDAAAAGAILALMFFAFILSVIFYVVSAFLLSRIFNKAGVAGWKAWVPVYNGWILLELGGQQGFWAVLALIPVVNIVSAVFMYIAMYHIGLKLGKEGAFVLLAIFLPLVWFVWLAVDNSTWKKTKHAAPAKSA
jgi:hypothetical protein